MVRQDMDIKCNMEKSTDSKIVRGEYSPLAFEYTDISEGGVCLFIIISLFHWTGNVCTQ